MKYTFKIEQTEKKNDLEYWTGTVEFNGYELPYHATADKIMLGDMLYEWSEGISQPEIAIMILMLKYHDGLL